MLAGAMAKAKEKGRPQKKKSDHDVEAFAHEAPEDHIDLLIKNDEAGVFTKVCSAAASQEALEDLEEGKEKVATESQGSHGSCGCLSRCLPERVTKPDLHYTNPGDLEGLGILKKIPKKRLLKMWEIFSSIDTDTDQQVDESEVRRFFYQLGEASDATSIRTKHEHCLRPAPILFVADRTIQRVTGTPKDLKAGPLACLSPKSRQQTRLRAGHRATCQVVPAD